MKVLLSTAYWPSLQYVFYVLNAGSVLIEQLENYQKQSYRNRTQILSANGVLDLSIPVQKSAPKELTKDIRISYTEHWQIRHWRAITSAYRNSPYFEYFEDDIAHFYSEKYELLLDYNLLQLRTVLKILKLRQDIGLTMDYVSSPADCVDLRERIHPKISFENDAAVAGTLKTGYYQTFGSRFGFTPNLSILDLLFNTGLESMAYLKK